MTEFILRVSDERNAYLNECVNKNNIRLISRDYRVRMINSILVGLSVLCIVNLVQGNRENRQQLQD